jgi:hypothetical protein
MTLGCDILWKWVSHSRFSDLEFQFELPENVLRILEEYVSAMMANMVIDSNNAFLLNSFLCSQLLHFHSNMTDLTYVFFKDAWVRGICKSQYAKFRGMWYNSEARADGVS